MDVLIISVNESGYGCQLHGVYFGCLLYADDDDDHHHLFAQYAEINSKICNVPDKKANSFSSNN